MSYLLYTVAGLIMSFMGFVFAMTGGSDAATWTGEALLVVYVGVAWYVIHKASHGEGRKVAFLLALPMPIVTAAEVAYLVADGIGSYSMPDSEEFVSACRGVGVEIVATPVSPVHSIAYVRETEYEPPFTHFTISHGTRVASLSYSNPMHPEAIEYIESGPNAVGERYFRTPRMGKQIGVSALTADVLVKYKLSPREELRKAPTEQDIVRYEVTVTDRRTNAMLGSLRYVIDAKKRRACGVTGKDTMDERSFVLHAIGLM